MKIETIERVDLAQLILTKNNERFMIIDVREADFYGGNIKGAINMPFCDFDNDKALLLARDVIAKIRFAQQQHKKESRGNRAKAALQEFKSSSFKSIDVNSAGSSFKLVFHCFYCRHRGPACAKKFVSLMHELEELKPFIGNIEVLILKGGWSKWKNDYKANHKLVENVQ